MKKLFAAFAAIALSASALSAQMMERGTPVGEWRSWGADDFATRYTPLDQITPENFEQLEVAWLWRGDNYSPGGPDPLLRSTPIYANGMMYTVAGSRRTVIVFSVTVWSLMTAAQGLARTCRSPYRR